MKKELTPKQKLRLRVLRDAKKQLQLGFYKTDSGGVTNATYKLDLGKDEVELQPLLKALRKTNRPCSVCARGSLFLSTVTLDNKCKIGVDSNVDNGSYDDHSIVDTRLKKLFTRTQLIMMEAAYEKQFGEGINPRLREKAITFGYSYHNSTGRLIAIISNAIKNNGIFKP